MDKREINLFKLLSSQSSNATSNVTTFVNYMNNNLTGSQTLSAFFTLRLDTDNNGHADIYSIDNASESASYWQVYINALISLKTILWLFSL